MLLKRRTKYLQIALNGNLDDARMVVGNLPQSENILIEAGTPLMKELGAKAIAEIRSVAPGAYLVADIKCADLADRLVQMVAEPQTIAAPALAPALSNISFFDALKMTAEQAQAARNRMRMGTPLAATAAGANAATVLGVSPIETIGFFIEECRKRGIDSMVDMMNVENPLFILKKLKNLPDVVILHRGVDETEFSREKQIPYYQIKQIKGNFDVLVSVAGGDTIRDIQSAFFNDADIVVVWKSFYQANEDTSRLAKNFLKEVR